MLPKQPVYKSLKAFFQGIKKTSLKKKNQSEQNFVMGSSMCWFTGHWQTSFRQERQS